MEQEIKSKYGVDIKIGDTVNYDAGVIEYDGEWKVLGIEDGQILLMSSNPVNEMFELSGTDAYLHGVENLDKECEKYGEGDGAEGARSFRVEDINRITGYDPKDSIEGATYLVGTIGEYGNKVKFIQTDENTISRSSSNGLKDSLERSFRERGW